MMSNLVKSYGFRVQVLDLVTNDQNLLNDLATTCWRVKCEGVYYHGLL